MERKGGRRGGGERPPKKNVRISSAPRPRPAFSASLLAAIPKRWPIGERGRAAVTTRSPPTRRIGPARHRRDHAPLSGEPFCGMFTSRPQPAPAAPPVVLPPVPGPGANRFGGRRGGGSWRRGPGPGAARRCLLSPTPSLPGWRRPTWGGSVTRAGGGHRAHTHTRSRTRPAHSHTLTLTHARTEEEEDGGAVGGARRGGRRPQPLQPMACQEGGVAPAAMAPSLPPRTHTLSHSPPPPPVARFPPAGSGGRARFPPLPPPSLFPQVPARPPRRPLGSDSRGGGRNWESACGGSSCYLPSTRRRAALNGGGTPPGADWPRGADRHGRTAHGGREGGRERGGVRERPLPAAEGGREPGEPVPPRRQPAFPSARTRAGRGGWCLRSPCLSPFGKLWSALLGSPDGGCSSQAWPPLSARLGI